MLERLQQNAATLRRLSFPALDRDLTGLPLYPLDRIKYNAGGGEIPHEEYLKVHTDLLSRDEWIIDGFGCVASAWERFSAADTLVYIDLPLFTHYRWVTKRLAKGLFVSPEGWPENSPMWSSTLNSYRRYWQELWIALSAPDAVGGATPLRSRHGAPGHDPRSQAPRCLSSRTAPRWSNMTRRAVGRTRPILGQPVRMF